MIRECWYPVLYSHEVKRNKPLAVVRFGEKLLFFRDKKTGEIACLGDKCPHRGAALSAGKINAEPVRGEEKTCAECPFHGLRFDSTGRCVLIPANGEHAIPGPQYNAKHYMLREEYGFIWLYWGKKTENLPPLHFFEDLANPAKPLVYTQIKDYWKCHYSRCIENQLDAVHVPFVHYNTIGRGHKTVVNGPALTELPAEMLVKAENEQDVGQEPKKGSQLPPVSKTDIHLAFRFPNIWQNYITDRMRVFIAFVPVDEHNTILYMRTYQGYMRFPLFAQIFNALLMKFSIKVAHQDRRVVHTQEPDKTELHMNEHLLSGDSPIMLYRQLRDKLQKSAENDETAVEKVQ